MLEQTGVGTTVGITTTGVAGVAGAVAGAGGAMVALQQAVRPSKPASEQAAHCHQPAT